jgi:Dinucleotide-utilizing enzymes involved in molybdopterin and thiamine biosynthesis family 1
MKTTKKNCLTRSRSGIVEHNRLQRLGLLIQEEGIQRLQDSCVLVMGLGGVGGNAVESLARSGVGKLIIVDGDVIQESNINRQLIATVNTIDKDKVQVMKDRIQEINPDCNVIAHREFFDVDKKELFDDKIDFVIDAIDTVSSKLDLIEICIKKKIPFISCLGMANRFDPSKLKVTRLDKTEYDPFAKALRTAARKRGMDLKIPVVFSEEIPIKQNTIVNEEGETRKEMIPPGSTAFVPPAAGLLCASYAVKILLNKGSEK